MVTFDELYEKIGRLVLILTLTAKSKLTNSNFVHHKCENSYSLFDKHSKSCLHLCIKFVPKYSGSKIVALILVSCSLILNHDSALAKSVALDQSYQPGVAQK